MKRWSILVCALLVGAAAPARAWCEATCLAPHQSASSAPHCPSHEPSSDAPAMSAANAADCPALESARPVQAKLDFALAPIGVTARTLAPSHPRTFAPGHPRYLRHLGHLFTPLRI